MATNKKITDLPAAALPITTGVKFEAVQGGLNVQVDADDMPGSAGGGAVDSVNGQTGVVVLNASGVGADPSGTAAGLIATEVTNRNAAIQTALRLTRTVTGAGAVVQSDDNSLIIFNSATPFNFTLDQLTASTKISFINYGVGVVTFIAGSGVTITGNVTLNGSSGTTYPSALVRYDSLTTPRIISGSGGGGSGTVESVTGDGVDNTDPDNPILSFPSLTDLGLTSDRIEIIIAGLAGDTVDYEVKWPCVVTGWRVVGDISGSIVVDVWKDSYANFPPAVGDTITGSEKPTLSSAIKNEDTSLTTWTDLTFLEGEWLRFSVDSASTLGRATVSLIVTRT